MFTVFVWIFSIATSVFVLSSAAIYYISYGLFIPHSNVTYSGAAFFWHASLLVSSFISFGIFFIHGYLAGRALWRHDYSKAAQTSLATLIVLGFFLVVHLIRFRYI